MELVTPEAGTIFWMVIVFGLVVFILGKFAWKPILNALNEREQYIGNALVAAEEAKNEVERLKAGNEEIIAEGMKAKEAIMRETLELKGKIIAEAKEKAASETLNAIENARRQIENEKAKAINEMKKYMAEISMMVAEQVIRKEIKGDKQQEELIEKMLDDIKLN
jgi:F-type H+-transporting ATPase subunit b